METMPVDLIGLVGTIGGILVVLVAVAGLTARYALKPIVEAISLMRDRQGTGRDAAAIMEQRIALLEQQVRNLEGSVDRLVEDADFKRQLEAPRG